LTSVLTFPSIGTTTNYSVVFSFFRGKTFLSRLFRPSGAYLACLIALDRLVEPAGRSALLSFKALPPSAFGPPSPPPFPFVEHALPIPGRPFFFLYFAPFLLVEQPVHVVDPPFFWYPVCFRLERRTSFLAADYQNRGFFFFLNSSGFRSPS